MAFNALPGMRITVSQFSQTVIVGDYFSVFEDESAIPDVYKWEDVTSYTEDNDHFTIGFDRIEYTIPKSCFESNRQLIQFRTIAEGQLSGNSNIEIKLRSRILPPKYNFFSAEISENVFSGTGIYTEKEINAGSISHVYGKFRLPIWLIAIGGGIASFACLWLFTGKIEKNWLFYIIISFFICIGIGTLIYLIFCIVARHRYASFLKNDVSTVEDTVFVVAPDGFGAIEQCVYSGTDLIPWSYARYFYETKYSVAIVCKDKSVCCIPKRIFQKSSQNDLVEFIAGRVEQS